MNPVFGSLAYLSYIFLPGAWLSFSLRRTDLSFWVRILLAAVLSPLVLTIQFYLLRLLGVGFEPTARLLPILNLPALVLIVRERPRLAHPTSLHLFGLLLILGISLVGFLPQLLDPQTRAYTGHAWMHTDIIYMLANGELVPEDTGLAGVTMAYPWAGHVVQGLLSKALGSPPALNFLWTNLIWAGLAYGFVYWIVRELGGSTLAGISAGAWLFFGVNLLGYPLSLGDYRFTPWLLEFVFFSQMPFALGFFSALIYLLVKDEFQEFSSGGYVLVGALLLSLGIIYPFLLPAAFGLGAAKVVAVLVQSGPSNKTSSWRKIIILGAVFTVTGILSVIVYQYVTQERSISVLAFPPRDYLIRKMIDSLIAPAPLYAGLVFMLPGLWKTKRGALSILSLGGLASILMYVLLHIPPVAEYKFMFTAAICLAPFPALALDRLTIPDSWRAATVLTLVTLILGAPFLHKMYTDWPWVGERRRPQADFQSFELRLGPDEPLAALAEVIRTQTPVNTILVADETEINLPTLASRPLYAHLAPKNYIGVNVESDHLILDIRGYDPGILETRRQDLMTLFRGEDEVAIRAALDHILTLQRPVAVILDEDRNAALARWLQREPLGRMLYEAQGASVWLIPAG